MYDQRLFNQDTGTGSGFAAEDAYNLYDKPLFADRSEIFKHKVGGRGQVGCWPEFMEGPLCSGASVEASVSGLNSFEAGCNRRQLCLLSGSWC